MDGFYRNGSTKGLLFKKRLTIGSFKQMIKQAVKPVVKSCNTGNNKKSALTCYLISHYSNMLIYLSNHEQKLTKPRLPETQSILTLLHLDVPFTNCQIISQQILLAPMFTIFELKSQQKLIISRNKFLRANYTCLRTSNTWYYSHSLNWSFLSNLQMDLEWPNT